MSGENSTKDWIDPDDALDLTKDDLKRGVWTHGGVLLTEAEGRERVAISVVAVSSSKD